MRLPAGCDSGIMGLAGDLKKSCKVDFAVDPASPHDERLEALQKKKQKARTD